jgi:type IV secretion system protein VirD4
LSTSSTTTTTGSGTFTNGSDYAVAAILAAFVFTTIGTWTTGQLAGLLFTFTWPHVGLSDALQAAIRWPSHLSDPRMAWPEPAHAALPGPVGFYTAAILVLATMITLTVLVTRRLQRGKKTRGFASRSQLMRNLSAGAVLAKAKRLRPDVTGRPTLTDVAVALGTATPSRLPLFASIENSVAVFAAPRQGKTSQVIIPWLYAWNGPALVTSVRSDVIENTLTLRANNGGPIGIIDLSDEGWPYRLRWSHLIGCHKYEKARQRADVMVQVGKDGADSTNAGFFGMSAVNLLAGWLHVAAISGRTMEDVLKWALTEGDDEPITLLADHPAAHPMVAAMLENIYAAPAETRSNLWTTAITAVAPLVGETARHIFGPSIANSFDIEDFLRRSGTIYVLVSEDDAADLAPLLTAFVQEVITVAKRVGKNMPGGRLTPPLALLLDEVANVVPLPMLPALMSYAGGSGIFTVPVFQSLAQARKRWGRDGADMLWNAATVKVALGGLTGDELDDLSRLAGKYRETITTIQHGPNGITRSPTISDRDTITPEEIRTLDENHREALIIHATTPAVKTMMVRHYEGPHRKLYAQAVEDARALRAHGDDQ